ncbi:MAG: NAD-dependent epimerase/dehydratase [Nevskia sp.]|nr:NAD-dependent epimerase/dehydratase [Nevskia sp.]
MPPLKADAGPLVAVTGATGFVGRHLVRELAACGMRVRILTRRDPVNSWWRDLALEVVPGSLNDASALRQLVAGTDAVVHGAGLIKAVDTAQFMAVNRDATRALAEATRRGAPAAHFLHISSLAAREPTLSGYAASKHAGEHAVLEVLGAGATVLRPPAVYGPGDAETLIFFRVASHRRVWVPGSTAARTALIHVSDLVAAIGKLIRAVPSGRVHAISDERSSGYSWHEILATAAQAVGNRAPKFRSLPRMALAAAALGGDLGRRFGYANMLTSEKLRELMHPNWTLAAEEQLTGVDWRPRYSLQSGFGTTVAWYRQAGWLADMPAQ